MTEDIRTGRNTATARSAPNSEIQSARQAKVEQMPSPWHPGEPFWANDPDAAERLFDFEERAARIEFDDGLSRGFAEMSAYCTMHPDPCERIEMLQKIVALHWERVNDGPASPGLEPLRDALRPVSCRW